MCAQMQSGYFSKPLALLLAGSFLLTACAPDGAFAWWMNSPVHRGSILSAKVTRIGIGYACSESSTYGGCYTLNFARP